MSDWRDPNLIGVDEPALDQSPVKGGVRSRNTLAVLLVVAIVGFVGLRAIAEPATVDDSTADAQVRDKTVTEEPTTSPTPNAPNRTTKPRPPDPSNVVEGSPVFDHETGWNLLIGGDRQMKVLGLDGKPTIELTTRGMPRGLAGNFIIYMTPLQDSGLLRYARLDDIDGPNHLLPGGDWYGYWGQSLIGGSGESQIWLRAGNYDQPNWKLWDFSGLEPDIVREVSAPSTIGGPSLHPLVLSARSGGLFAGVEGDMKRVAEGNLLAVTDHYVVVEECATPFECETVWLDRNSFKVNTDIVPPPSSERFAAWGIQTSPDGTYLLLPDLFDGKSLLWNLRTGEVVSNSFDAGEPIAFSPDSRYIAGKAQSGRLEIMDLETREVRAWSSATTLGVYTAVFVPA